MADRARRWWWALAIAACLTIPARAGEGPTIRLELDTRDLPRHLAHSRMEIPCHPGKLALWYPKWIPGTHAPSGPLKNVAGLRVETPDGQPIPWRRDEVEIHRIVAEVPEGVSSVIVRLDMICERSATEAAGYLTFGNESVALVNWGPCLMYPEGPSADELQVEATLLLPRDWEHASALEMARTEERNGNRVLRFQPVSLNELVDNPVIAGRHFRRIALETGPYPPAALDLVSESPEALKVGNDVVGIYSRVVREAGALFGTCHYPSFHFLVTCSDDLGYLGLEHLACSVNGVHERDLVTPGHLRGWVGNLLPHEYVHSWCGKFRRPAGMCTPNYHTPQKTRLLWVYEGLTEYLGEVLMARSGMIDLEEYRRMLAANIGSLRHREGRRWRSLEDTAIASHLLRSPTDWSDLRRGQDYYFEGALIWLEADAIIRQQTGGKRSLDDFCRKFLGTTGTTSTRVMPYEFEEVVTTLNDVCSFKWESFLRDRIEKPMEALPTDVVGRCGYRLEYSDQAPTAASRISRSGAGAVSAVDSIGLALDGEGKVTVVVPGMVADRSGVGPGMKVLGVDGETFHPQRLLDAIAGSKERKQITLLVAEANRIRTIRLDYADGPRYLHLVHDPKKPDLLAAIIRPIAKGSEAASSAPPRGYVAYRTSAPIRIDGRLDDDEWNDASWTEDFLDIEGDIRPRPRFRTRAKMRWDDQYLYIGAKLEEPHVWATLTKHDSVIFQDNDFEVFIDPDGDNHEYYEIEINALNTEWDLFLGKPYRNGGPAVDAWEIPGLKTAVHVDGTINNPKDTDRGWTVEMAFPWKVLREHANRPAPPKAGDQWRINFSRVEWQHEIVNGKYRKVPKTHEDNWVWSPQGAIDMHRPERWGYLQFSDAKPGTDTYRPDPSGPIRDRLMQVYHAQAAFREKNKRWAATVEELALPAPSGLPTHRLTMKTTPEGYTASATFTRPDGQPQAWTVRQDSRLRSEGGERP